jgi:undecaprenyl-diphosphatase
MLSNLDVWLFSIVNGQDYPDFFIDAMKVVSGFALWVGIAVVLLLRRGMWARRWLPFVAVLALSLSDLLTFRILKPFFERERPCYALEGVNLWEESCGSEFGMPSNHAANTMAVCFLLCSVLRQRRYLLIPLLVGFSRVILGVHYPGDVLAGFFVGLLVALAFLRLKTPFKVE